MLVVGAVTGCSVARVRGSLRCAELGSASRIVEVPAPQLIPDRSELRSMIHLAAPLVLAELGWMAMGVVDTMVVGRLSAESIGAVSLGTTMLNTVGIFAGGLLLGLDTFVAQSFGAGDRADCRRSLVNGIWLAIR